MLGKLKRKDYNEQKLKVLFITSWFPTLEDPLFGIFIKEHASAISLLNDVVILHCNYDEKLKIPYSIKKIRISKGCKLFDIKYRFFPIPKKPDINLKIIVRYVLMRLIATGFIPDIIHSNIYNSCEISLSLKRMLKIPVVVTEHSSAFPLKKLSLNEKELAIRYLSKVDCIMPVSDFLKDSIKKLGINNKYVTVPNVVDTDIFQFRNGMLKNNKEVRAIFVGSLEKMKGVYILLEAINALKERNIPLKIDIVGEGEEKEGMEEMCRQIKIENDVSFLGRKTKKELAQLLSKAHFFIQPSLMETFSCVLIEAMATGLPVVASKVGAIPEIVSPRVGILIEPNSVEALSNGIEWMIENLENFPKKDIASMIEDNYSFNAVSRKIDSVYRDVLNTSAN